MSEDLNFRAGIAAAEAGDLAQAASFFAQVVKEDPGSEKGWFMLGSCLSDPEQSKYCFQRVLAINPNHPQAKSKLEHLTKPAPASAPPFHSSESPWEETTVTKQPAISHPVAPGKISQEQFPDSDDTLAATTGNSATPNEELKKTNERKPSNKSLILTTAFASTMILCGLGTAILLLTGQLEQVLSLNFNRDNSRLQSSRTATVTPFGPTFTPTSTPDPAILPTPKPTVEYTTDFQESPCSFFVLADANVRCGYVTVPEDRTGDPSQTIRLAVAVYKSYNDNPEPDPVIFLQGGPGAEAVELSAEAFYVLVDPFLSKRDFIVFDQRGTGLSNPSLQCDELTKTFSQDIHGLIDISTRELVYSNSFLSCQGLLSAQEINLNAYTTVESAADVRDILKLLGYPKANLYGASYGTRLAQVIMREYPEIVRSAILDSVVPVETSLFSGYPDAIESGLSTLFTDCTNDSQCNTAYPDLETEFWDLVNKLDTNPVTVTTSNYPSGTITQTVTGTTVMNIVLGSIKNSRFISTAPQSIYRFKDGDFSTLVIEQAGLPFAFEGISPGLFISMMCHEHILSTTPEELQNASSRHIIKEFAWLPFYGDVANIFKTCKSWGATGPVVGENDSIISDIPSLIITGAYDPTTPPKYAKQITGQLSQNYYFEFSDQGHTPTAGDTSGCATNIALQFLDDPSTEPDGSCLNDTESVNFVVPYTGEPALALETIQTNGISVNVPKDWLSLGGGFYYRGNSPFDLTEASILQIPASTNDIEEWFSLSAYGYRGLDSPLIPAGEQNANGIAWKLFTSSSYGRPVDIAMVDDGSWTVMIILFCNQDEHDALYNTVFLPMIDSAGQ